MILFSLPELRSRELKRFSPRARLWTALSGVFLAIVSGLSPSLLSPASAASCPTVDSFGNVSVLPSPTVDWSGCHLDGALLSGADLRQANLTGASLVNANLLGALLTGATVSGADFTGATLSGVRSGQIVGSPLSLPSGYQVVAGYLLGPRAYLSGANLAGLNLSGANLVDANLSSANLTGASLTASDLTRTNLSSSNLTGASLSSANLTSAIMGAGIILAGVSSGGVVGQPSHAPTGAAVVCGYLIAPQVNLRGANLSGCDLSGTSLSYADASNADLSQANLTQGSGLPVLLHTKLVNANLAEANLTSVNVAGADLTNADLSGATLTGVWSAEIVGVAKALPPTFRLVGGYLFGPRANLTAARLTGADLSSLDLTGARLDSVIFTDVNLTNSVLRNVYLGTANLSKTVLTGVRSGGIQGIAAGLPSGFNLVSGYVIGPGANLSGEDLSGIDFSSANLAGVTSGGITGVPAALPPAYHLTHGYFAGPGAELSHVSLSGWDLTGQDLTGANMAGSDLRAAILQGAKLTHTNMVNANLSNLDLSRQDLTGATLTGANVTGTDFTSVNWNNSTCMDGRRFNFHANGSCVLGLESVPPSSTIVAPTSYASNLNLRVTWAGSDGLGSGIAAYDVRYNWSPATGGPASPWVSLTSGSYVTSASLSGIPGRRYCFQSRARDHVGNVGPWSVSSCSTTPLDDRDLSASAGWSRNRSNSSYAGTYSTTTKIGASLTTTGGYTFQVGIIASACGTCGKVAVYVGTTRVGAITLYSPLSTVARKAYWLPRFKSRKYGAIKLVTIPNSGSSGKYVLIDAVLTTAL